MSRRKLKPEETDFIPNSPYIVVSQGADSKFAGLTKTKRAVIDYMRGDVIFNSENDNWNQIYTCNVILPENKLIVSGIQKEGDKFEKMTPKVAVYDLSSRKLDYSFFLDKPGRVGIARDFSVTGTPLLLKDFLIEEMINPLQSKNEELIENEACPLCGSLEHPYATHIPVFGLQADYLATKRKLLDKTKDIDVAIRLEFFWQDKLGYKRDKRSYKETINNFKPKTMLHITEKTITFKGSKDSNLTGIIIPDIIKLKDGTILNIEKNHKEFILKNNYKSQHSNERYVYIKRLLLELDNSTKEVNIYDNIRQWAKERGIYEKGNSHTQYVKLMEESGELAKALLTNDTPEIIDAIGDMVVVLTNLAKIEGHNIEDCIDSAYNEIKNRQGKMIGLSSIRRQASAAKIAAAESQYRLMMEQENA